MWAKNATPPSAPARPSDAIPSMSWSSEPEAQDEHRRDLDQLVEEAEEDERQDPGPREQHEVRAEDRRDRARRADHRDLRRRVDQDLGQRPRRRRRRDRTRRTRRGRAVLDVVAEDPEIDHVAGDVDQVHVQEHAREHGQRLLAQVARPPTRPRSSWPGTTPYVSKSLSTPSIRPWLASMPWRVGEGDDAGDDRGRS